MEATEFNKLTYPEKLKYWEQTHPDGIMPSGEIDDKGNEVSIYPNKENIDEIKQYNEVCIKRYLIYFEKHIERHRKMIYENDPESRKGDEETPIETLKKSLELFRFYQKPGGLEKDFSELIKLMNKPDIKLKTESEIQKCNGIRSDLIQTHKEYIINDLSKITTIIDERSYVLIHSTGKYLEYLENFIKNDYKSTVKSNKIEPTFESLFRDPNNALEVERIFELKGYTKDGVWQGNSMNKTELSAAYHVLKPLLIGTKDTPQKTVFYNKFGLSVAKDVIKNNEYITDRSLRNEPFNEDREEFEKIFAHILASK